MDMREELWAGAMRAERQGDAAAYESLLKSRRHMLHRRIGESLRDRFPNLAQTEPEIIAHHFTQAGLTIQ